MRRRMPAPRLLLFILLALAAAAPAGAAEPSFFWHEPGDADPDSPHLVTVEVSAAHPAFRAAFPTDEAFRTLRDSVHARALDDGAAVKDPALERAFPPGETYWFLGATAAVGLPLEGCRLTFGPWDGLELLFPMAEKGGRLDPAAPHLVVRGTAERPAHAFLVPGPEPLPEAARARFLAALAARPVRLAPAPGRPDSAAFADLSFLVKGEADTEPVSVGFDRAFRPAEHLRAYPGRFPNGGRWLVELSVPKSPAAFTPWYAALAVVGESGEPLLWVEEPSDLPWRYPVRGLARLAGEPADAVVAGRQYAEGDFPALLRWDGRAYRATPLGGGGL